MKNVPVARPMPMLLIIVLTLDVLGGYLFGGFLLGVSLWIYLYLKEKGFMTPKLKRGERAVDPQPISSHR